MIRTAPAAELPAARLLDPRVAESFGGSVVEPLIDGVAFLGAQAEALARTRGPGDAIHLLCWQVDPDFAPAGVALGALLADKAAAGVDVRVIVNAIPAPLNPWRENRAAARRLQRWRVGGVTPLAERVLCDVSGATFSGSQHQKALVVVAGGEAQAFAGGLDWVPGHHDHAPHRAMRWRDGRPFGFHDVGVRVRGDAVRALWENFASRWREALRAPRTPLWVATTRLLGLGNPAGATRLPAAPVPRFAALASGTAAAAQVWRSRFRARASGVFGAGVPWSDGAGAIDELGAGLAYAIRRAERLIYIEDQFLCDHGHEIFGLGLPASLERMPPASSLFPLLAARLRERPGLEVVMVSSGLSDPIDFAPGPRNRHLTPSLARTLAAAGGRGISVYRVEGVTVHSKLVIVDDELCAIGSGNFRTRATSGVDSELQVAWTAHDGTIGALRRALLHEHQASGGGLVRL